MGRRASSRTLSLVQVAIGKKGLRSLSECSGAVVVLGMTCSYLAIEQRLQYNTLTSAVFQLEILVKAVGEVGNG